MKMSKPAETNLPTFASRGIRAILFDQNGVLTTRSDAAVRAAQSRSTKFNGYASKDVNNDLYCGRLDERTYAERYAGEARATMPNGAAWDEAVDAPEARDQALAVLRACTDTDPIPAMVHFVELAKAKG